MKTKLFAIALTLVSSTAFAQGFNPYRLDFMRPACNPFFNPYDGQNGSLSMICHLPAIEGKPVVTYAFVQGSVGTFGRETAFLNLVNVTNEINLVVIEYTVDGKAGTFYQQIHLRPKERYSIGLHTDPEFLEAPREWNFSATVQFQKSGAAEMVWYRAGDNMQVDSKVGQEVR